MNPQYRLTRRGEIVRDASLFVLNSVLIGALVALLIVLFVAWFAPAK